MKSTQHLYFWATGGKNMEASLTPYEAGPAPPVNGGKEGGCLLSLVGGQALDFCKAPRDNFNCNRRRINKDEDFD